MSNPASFDSDSYPSDVQIVAHQGRTFLLVGTAHISQESADLVRRVISQEQPDCVCVELDAQRYAALSAGSRWEDLDLKEVIRKRQISALLANLILASYQKRLGGQLGVTPGIELLAATKVAEEHDIPVALCDRAVRVTMLRAWRSTSFLRKFWLLSGSDRQHVRHHPRFRRRLARHPAERRAHRVDPGTRYDVPGVAQGAH